MEGACWVVARAGGHTSFPNSPDLQNPTTYHTTTIHTLAEGVPGAFLLLAIDPAKLDGAVKFEPAVRRLRRRLVGTRRLVELRPRDWLDVTSGR